LEVLLFLSFFSIEVIASADVSDILPLLYLSFLDLLLIKFIKFPEFIRDIAVRVFESSYQVSSVLALTLSNESVGSAFVASPACPAHSVHIIL
jgi:hypothetical protein